MDLDAIKSIINDMPLLCPGIHARAEKINGEHLENSKRTLSIFRIPMPFYLSPGDGLMTDRSFFRSLYTVLACFSNWRTRESRVSLNMFVKQIIVVDDDEYIRKTINLILKKNYADTLNLVTLEKSLGM